jgi:hypothetical protein
LRDPAPQPAARQEPAKRQGHSAAAPRCWRRTATGRRSLNGRSPCVRRRASPQPALSTPPRRQPESPRASTSRLQSALSPRARTPAALSLRPIPAPSPSERRVSDRGHPRRRQRHPRARPRWAYPAHPPEPRRSPEPTRGLDQRALEHGRRAEAG